MSSVVEDRNSYAPCRLVIATHTAESLLIAARHRDGVGCHVEARSSEEASRLIATLRELLPEADDPEADSVRVAFWNLDDGRVRYVARRIALSEWDTVGVNYHWQTRDHLDALVQRPPMLAAGKLILWHGPPGTGKTWPLRALLREWRHWAEAHFILDPETFFSQSAVRKFERHVDGLNRDTSRMATCDPGRDWQLVLLPAQCDRLLAARILSSPLEGSFMSRTGETADSERNHSPRD